MSIRPILGRIRRTLRKPWTYFISQQFHRIYYTWLGRQTWEINTFLGVRILKCPFDLWIYQEIIHETKPDLIIECGTLNGGSTLYFATLLDIVGHGEIVSVDIDPQDNLPTHPRARFIKASSVAEEVVAEMTEISKGKRTMVILDSDHSRDHVLKELRAYAGLVSPGCYMVVEDGNVNGHPVFFRHGPGPTEALKIFHRENNDFEVDRHRERHLVSFNPGGYLRRK